MSDRSPTAARLSRPAGRRAAFLIAVTVQLVVLYWPRTVTPAGGVGIDKPVHAAIFAAVVWTGARLGLPLAGLVPVLLAHAAISELAQHAVLPGRSGDPFDAVADAVGVALAALAVRVRRAQPDDPADVGPRAPG